MHSSKGGDSAAVNLINKKKEIDRNAIGRVRTPHESCWSIMGCKCCDLNPAVENSPVHLPEEHDVVLRCENAGTDETKSNLKNKLQSCLIFLV